MNTEDSQKATLQDTVITVLTKMRMFRMICLMFVKSKNGFFRIVNSCCDDYLANYAFTDPSQGSLKPFAENMKLNTRLQRVENTINLLSNMGYRKLVLDVGCFA